MPHLILWACQLFLIWSLGVWVPIGFLQSNRFLPAMRHSWAALSVFVSQIPWKGNVPWCWLSSDKNVILRNFHPWWFLFLDGTKFIFPSDYTINLEAHLQPELKKLLPFSCYFSMLRFDCAQLLGILYFTKWSNASSLFTLAHGLVSSWLTADTS